MPVPFVSGWQRLTSSGAVGVSGAPIWISGFTFLSGGTVGQPYFRNGSGAASDAIVFQAGGGTISSYSPMQVVGQLPVAFANGCYVSFDANTTAVTVFYVEA